MDNILAQMKGWETKSVLSIRANHQRETGSYFGKIRGNYEVGKFAHFMGYYLPFLVGRSILEVRERPYFFAGLAMLVGHLIQIILLRNRFSNKQAISFLRKKQKRYMLKFMFGSEN